MTSSRALTWAGILIALAGIVALIWLQADVRTFSDTSLAQARLQIAMAPLMVVGIGILVSGAGQILFAVRSRSNVSN